MAIEQRDAVGGTVIHFDHGTQGGFNWSSQRSMTEGCDGEARGLDAGVDGKISMYSKIAFASSTRVFQRRELSSSTCIRDQNAFIIAPARIGPHVRLRVW
jgi:hypothetical protein